MPQLPSNDLEMDQDQEVPIQVLQIQGEAALQLRALETYSKQLQYEDRRGDILEVEVVVNQEC